MKEKKISIIVPVYNCSYYLEDCLDSLVNLQSVDEVEVEVVIVDDGSTDDSPQICDRYAQKYANVLVYHTINQGVSCARNYGLNKSHGDWIMYVDGDDTLRFDTLMVLSKNNFGEYDILRFGFNEVSSQGIHPFNPNFSDNRLDYLRLVVSRRTVLGVWGGIYKRSLIVDNHILFDSGIRTGEDWLVLFKLIVNSSTFTYVNENLYGYTVNQQSVTRKKIDFVRPDGLIAFMRILDYAAEHKVLISPKDIAKAQSSLRRSMMKEAIKNKSKQIYVETDFQLNKYVPQSLFKDIFYAERLKHRLGFVLYFVLDIFYRCFPVK